MAVAVASVATFLGCSSDSHVAGNSAETGSPELAGLLVLENGMPAARAIVQCVPQNFNATLGLSLPASYSTEADSNGFYTLDSIPEGVYAIEAFHEESGERLLVQNLHVVVDDSAAVNDTLHFPGVVKLSVDSSVEEGTEGVATVIGTTILRPVVVHDGELKIDSLPANTLALRIYLGKDTLEIDTLVRAGDTVRVNFDVDTVAQDTTVPDTVQDTLVVSFVAPLALPEGSDTLTSFISNIPLALRLTTDNCNFDTLAGMTGRWEVVRIATDGSRSKKLPITNAYFDTLAQEAVFWVNVDSLNVTDSLELSFDSSMESAYASDVFPTNRSYAVVWHYDSGISPIEDSAEKGYFDGTASKASLVDGVVGSGISLAEDGYVVAENSAELDSARKQNLVFDASGTFCFSLWVQLESLEVEQTLFEKPLEYALRYVPEQGFVVEHYQQASEDAEAEGTDGSVNYKYSWISGTAGISAGKWIYVAFSRHQPTLASFYVDDVKVEHVLDKVEWDGERETAENLKVGGFTGKIGELMLGGCYRDDSWTLLAYLNQKPADFWPVLRGRK